MFDLTLGWIGRIGGNHRILLPKLKVSCLPPQKNTQEKCRTFSFSHTYSSFPPYHQCSIRFGIFVGGYSTNEYHSIPNWIPNYSINPPAPQPHLRTVGICCGRKSRWGRGCGPPATKGRLELLQGQPRSDGCSWFLNVFNFLLDLYLFGIVWIYTGVLITYSHTVDK